MAAYRLIIADDEPDILRGLCNAVCWADLGFEVVAAFADGREVIAYLSEHDADAILTDIVMSRVGGLEVARWVRENRPAIKVVLLSAYAEFTLAQKAIEHRVEKYLLKPTRLTDLNAAFEEIRRQLDEERVTSSEEDTPPQEGSEHYIIQEVCAYVHDHITEGISLQEAAETLHFNPSYLSRLFKGKTGEGFSEYVIRMKIEYAKRLMDTTHCRVYEAADAVGYRDIRYFAKVFYRMVGVNPSEYRKNPQKTGRIEQHE